VADHGAIGARADLASVFAPTPRIRPLRSWPLRPFGEGELLLTGRRKSFLAEGGSGSSCRLEGLRMCGGW
jgi:hypothetical protein